MAKKGRFTSADWQPQSTSRIVSAKIEPVRAVARASFNVPLNRSGDGLAAARAAIVRAVLALSGWSYFFFLPPPALVPPFGFLGALFEPGPLSGIVASSAWSERPRPYTTSRDEW